MARRKPRNPAQRLRASVDALPQRTRTAMLDGIDHNRIIVGAYTDPRSGGICPMLAAHRNGGRTSLGSFAIAWDAFTGARRPRLATRREIRALRSYLEISLLRDEQGGDSLTAIADQIRSERTAAPTVTATPAAAEGIRITRSARAHELRDRLRFNLRRAARHDDAFKDLLAAAEERLAERRADELLRRPQSVSPDRVKTISGT
jgi:hypothetical protein